jgi:hypothetical protein
MANSFSLNRILTADADSPRLSYFEYIYVFMLIIYAGRANNFVESGSFTGNPFGVMLPIILTVILALRWKIKFDATFYFLIFCFAIYFTAISIKDTQIHPSFFLGYGIKFFSVYVVLKALKTNLFKIYEQVLYFLAIVGLFMWVVQTILGGDTLFYYFSKIPGMSAFSYVTGEGANAILYSVQPTEYSIISFMIPRNCGFAQEPGSFAVYICLAIFINLFITNSEKYSKKLFWVLVVALISTQSTTGYMIFMLIMVFYVFSKNLNKVLLLLPFVLAALIYVSTLPFMSNKIIDLITETTQLDQLIEGTIGREETATPQRFTSFMITFIDFKNNPILGLGPDNDKSWINKVGARISPISGIGNLMAQFGIVGLLFFIICTIRSSFYFAKYYNYNGKYLLFFIIIFVSISYSIIILPLLMSFWMFQLFGPRDLNQNEEDNLVLTTQNSEADQ